MGSIGLERKSSIELEPLTLSFSELQLAREAAMYILNNHPLEEAIKIFTEGLHPVPMARDEGVLLGEGIGDGEEVEEEEEEEEEDEDEVLLMDYCVIGEDHQFSHQDRRCFDLRDTVTAPF